MSWIVLRNTCQWCSAGFEQHYFGRSRGRLCLGNAEGHVIECLGCASVTPAAVSTPCCVSYLIQASTITVQALSSVLRSANFRQTRLPTKSVRNSKSRLGQVNRQDGKSPTQLSAKHSTLYPTPEPNLTQLTQPLVRPIPPHSTPLHPRHKHNKHSNLKIHIIILLRVPRRPLSPRPPRHPPPPTTINVLRPLPNPPIIRSPARIPPHELGRNPIPATSHDSPPHIRHRAPPAHVHGAENGERGRQLPTERVRAGQQCARGYPQE